MLFFIFSLSDLPLDLQLLSFRALVGRNRLLLLVGLLPEFLLDGLEVVEQYSIFLFEFVEVFVKGSEFSILGVLDCFYELDDFFVLDADVLPQDLVLRQQHFRQPGLLRVLEQPTFQLFLQVSIPPLQVFHHPSHLGVCYRDYALLLIQLVSGLVYSGWEEVGDEVLLS